MAGRSVGNFRALASGVHRRTFPAPDRCTISPRPSMTDSEPSHPAFRWAVGIGLPYMLRDKIEGMLAVRHELRWRSYVRGEECSRGGSRSRPDRFLEARLPAGHRRREGTRRSPVL